MSLATTLTPTAITTDGRSFFHERPVRPISAVAAAQPRRISLRAAINPTDPFRSRHRAKRPFDPFSTVTISSTCLLLSDIIKEKPAHISEHHIAPGCLGSEWDLRYQDLRCPSAYRHRWTIEYNGHQGRVGRVVTLLLDEKSGVVRLGYWY